MSFHRFADYRKQIEDLKAALQYYAEGHHDKGKRARQALGQAVEENPLQHE